MHAFGNLEFPSLASDSLTYLDSASTCQTPKKVIEAMAEYLTAGHGSPNRGMHRFAEFAADTQQLCREKVAAFIGAEAGQIIFTKSATESINLVAHSLAAKIQPGQSILVTQMEHHANLLPWQRLCEQTGARLNILPISQAAELDTTLLESLLADDCALFAFVHTSNLFGTQNHANRLIATAQSLNVPTLVDGAQSVAHQPVAMQVLAADYYVFSAHKLYGPTGIGVLFAKDPESLNPLLLGGGVVNRVTDRHYQLTEEVSRFEAGSANMLGIVGLSAAIDFIQGVGLNAIHAHEKSLIPPILALLKNHGLTVISHKDSASIISFTSQRYHSHDIATFMSEQNVAVRAGHMCAQPGLKALGYNHCVRISLGVYNSLEDTARLDNALALLKATLD